MFNAPWMKPEASLKILMTIMLVGCGGGPDPMNLRPSIPVVEAVPRAAETRILVIGQSVASNCNEHIYGPVSNVLQVALNGDVVPAKDPFEWADCKGGSMWMPLGRKLIEGGVSDKVVFMPIGVGATSVRAWQPGGNAYPKLIDAISLIRQEGIVFDYAFWQQGTSDFGMSRAEYGERLSAVIADVSGKIPVKRWLIALHSRCFNVYDQDLEAAQRAVANSLPGRTYLGANGNSLGNEFRFDMCHLNQQGQEEMASLWLQAIKDSMRN